MSRQEYDCLGFVGMELHSEDCENLERSKVLVSGSARNTDGVNMCFWECLVCGSVQKVVGEIALSNLQYKQNSCFSPKMTSMTKKN